MKGRTILDNLDNNDGLDRRGFLKCMAWAGTGMLWVMRGGVPRSYSLSQLIGREGGAPSEKPGAEPGDFRFVQISDSHIGFSKEANPDVVGTLQAAITRINALREEPAFVLHTGDLSHLSREAEFDTLDQVLKGMAPSEIRYVPGEHDVLGDNGAKFRSRYGKGTRGNGWSSFEFRGTHFIGLVNVLDLKPGGLGMLGKEQLSWLAKDVEGCGNSTPIVVFTHVPLWAVYPEWGWGTDDAAEALSLLRRFGSVTVLNGHIHQTLQKVEGNITFHTAMSTAFPQPPPGGASSPGPMKVPAERLRSLLGLTTVRVVGHEHSLAVTDVPLLAASGAPPAKETDAGSNNREGYTANLVRIENFTFAPQSLRVQTGATVTWVNGDDMPHTVVSTRKLFASPALDTGDQFSWKFVEPGGWDYYCSIHPRMTGTIIVE